MSRTSDFDVASAALASASDDPTPTRFGTAAWAAGSNSAAKQLSAMTPATRTGRKRDEVAKTRLASSIALAMSTTAKTVHPEGRNLHAIVDHLLDNGGVPGDTIMTLTDTIATGPTSTFVGCSLLNWLMLSTMEWLKEKGHDLPVLRSQNIPGAIEHNRAVGEKYKHRLSRQLA